MTTKVNVKTVKATAVEPPPLVKGRRGSMIPAPVLEAMATTVKEGGWASIEAVFDTKEQAGTALTRFKKALSPLLEDLTMTGRIWGSGKETKSDGTEGQAAPFHFAIGDKEKV